MMERITTDNPQTPTEVFFNTYYAKNGEVWCRGLGDDCSDISLRDLIRKAQALDIFAADDSMEDDEALDESMYDDLVYGVREPRGVLALFYQAAALAGEFNAQFKKKEDADEKKLPIGDPLEGTVCGYRIRDLLILAETLRMKGITADDLHSITEAVEMAIECARKDFFNQAEKAFREVQNDG